MTEHPPDEAGDATPQQAPTDDATVLSTGAGPLYVVATPIGNLSDLSARAAQVLRQVRWVAAEDTRASRPLLDSLGVRPTLYALHQYNEAQASDALVARLAAGESGALITDAGTPAISDPGAHLVAAAHRAGVRVVPVPGASAPVALLSAAGLPPAPFLFAGFLPQRPRASEQRLQQLRAHCDALGAHLVLFEAPHRIARTLQTLQQVYGEQRMLVIGRELTKRFEEVRRGTVAQAIAWLAERPTRQRGEFVLAVQSDSVAVADADVDSDGGSNADDPAQGAAAGSSAAQAAAKPALPAALPDPRTLLRRLLRDLPPSRAVKLARDLTGVPHRDLYALALQLKGDGPSGADGESDDETEGRPEGRPDGPPEDGPKNA